MSAHDTTVLPSCSLDVRNEQLATEVGDLFMRMFLSRFKNWPNTLTGVRPSVPTNYHVNRISAPTIDVTLTTQPASYEIYDPQAPGGAAWVDLSNTVFSRAITYFAGVDTSSIGAAVANAANALAAASSALTLATASMPKTGGTFSGPLTLAADATLPLQPVAYEQLQAVQTVANAALPLAGGTMTGPIALPANPTLNLQAATKQYVDVAVSGASSYSGVVTPSLLNLLVQSTTLTTPPGSPSTNQMWFIPAGTVPAGMWSGQAGRLAKWSGTAWVFSALIDGTPIWDTSISTFFTALASFPTGLSIVSNATVSASSFGAI